MNKFKKGMHAKDDGAGNYQLIGPYSEKLKKELWFGAVQIKKNYVSYHLMPVYMFPDLVKEIPPSLKKRMQGKSCFNFKEVNKELFDQLKDLTEKSYNLFNERFDKI
jgi:hypothetical protein